jgi:predicted exporter
MSEAKVSALIVAALAGVGLTLMLANALRDWGAALAVTVPLTLALGGVMALFASDGARKRDNKFPKGE